MVHFLGGSHLEHLILAHDACVVHQPVQGLFFCHDLLEGRLQGLRVGQLAVNGLHPHAEALRRFPAILFKRFRRLAGKGPDVAAFFGEPVQHGVADAPVRAGQHDVFSFQKQWTPPFILSPVM